MNPVTGGPVTHGPVDPWTRARGLDSSVPQPARTWPLVLVLLAALVSARGTARQAPGPIRLIVQGDDMGVAHGVDVATIEAYKNGILRSANVIVTGPWLPEAAQFLKDNPGIDAGVHLALTSEWSAVKWRPLTHAPSLVDEHGFFYPMVWPRDDFPPNTSLKTASPDLGEIERELRAQIELAKAMIPGVSYTWEHMGFGGLAPDVRPLVAKLTPSTAWSRRALRSASRCWAVCGNGFGRRPNRQTRREAETLGPGTWLMVDHAAIDSPETRALGHKGYE